MPAPVPWLLAFRRLATGQGVLLLVRCPEVGDGGGGGQRLRTFAYSGLQQYFGQGPCGSRPTIDH